MSSRKVFLCVFLLFALLSSPTAAKVCNSTSPPPDCTELILSGKSSLDLSNFTFTNLTKIYLTYNKLSEMPRLPASAKATLQLLRLLGNKIASVPADYFSDFRSLTVLDLGNNELSEMPAIPDFVKTKLTAFYISGNKISEIPAGYFSDFSELSILSLHGNEISRFPPGTSLGHLGKLGQLRIDQMDCDCATLRVWQQIAAMTSVSELWIYKNDSQTFDFPCGGDLSSTTLQQLRMTTCTSAAPPSTTGGVREIKTLIIAILILILM